MGIVGHSSSSYSDSCQGDFFSYTAWQEQENLILNLLRARRLVADETNQIGLLHSDPRTPASVGIVRPPR